MKKYLVVCTGGSVGGDDRSMAEHERISAQNQIYSLIGKFPILHDNAEAFDGCMELDFGAIYEARAFDNMAKAERYMSILMDYEITNERLFKADDEWCIMHEYKVAEVDEGYIAFKKDEADIKMD